MMGWLGADLAGASPVSPGGTTLALAGDLQPPSPLVGAGCGRATAKSLGRGRWQRPTAGTRNPARETLSVELSPLGSKAHGAARSVFCSRRLWQSHTKAVRARTLKS